MPVPSEVERAAAVSCEREPARVDEVGDEPADVGVHAPALLEEDAAVLGDRRVAAEQVLEHGAARAARVGALRDLGELERVAEQDQVAGRGADRDRVGERDLPGLVDHEVVERRVELLAREQPGGAGDELHVGVGEAGDLGRVPDPVAVVLGLVAVARLLQPAEASALPRGLVLDRGEQVVDHLVALRGDADPEAPREQVDDDLGARARSCRCRAGPARTGSSPSSDRASRAIPAGSIVWIAPPRSRPASRGGSRRSTSSSAG